MWWTETLIYFLKAYAIFFAGMFTGIFVMALMHAAKRSDEEADRDFRVGFRDKL